MEHIVFAQDGEFVSFCRRWGDAASVLGFVLSLTSVLVALVGFFLTLRGQRKIREAAEKVMHRAALQVALGEASAALRQVEAMRDAIRHQIWQTAIIRGNEGRLAVASLRTNRRLDDSDMRELFGIEDALRLAVQYIEQRLFPQGHGMGVLAGQHRRGLDRAVRVLGELLGQLQSAVMEA